MRLVKPSPVCGGTLQLPQPTGSDLMTVLVLRPTCQCQYRHVIDLTTAMDTRHVSPRAPSSAPPPPSVCTFQVPLLDCCTDSQRGGVYSYTGMHRDIQLYTAYTHCPARPVAYSAIQPLYTIALQCIQRIQYTTLYTPPPSTDTALSPNRPPRPDSDAQRPTCPPAPPTDRSPPLATSRPPPTPPCHVPSVLSPRLGVALVPTPFHTCSLPHSDSRPHMPSVTSTFAGCATPGRFAGRSCGRNGRPLQSLRHIPPFAHRLRANAPLLRRRRRWLRTPRRSERSDLWIAAGEVGGRRHHGLGVGGVRRPRLEVVNIRK